MEKVRQWTRYVYRFFRYSPSIASEGIMQIGERGFIIGADLSLLRRNMAHGAGYFSNGMPIAPVGFLKRQGITWARLRLFHSPSGEGAQCNDLEYTAALAGTLGKAGYSILLDIHYSDTWADPAKQHMPKAWANLSFDELEEEVYRYTAHVIDKLNAHGVVPGMVQVGNEITPGMLWEHGRVAGAHKTNEAHWRKVDSSNEAASWRRFGRLLNAGIQAIQDRASGPVETMIHIDRGGDVPTNRWFFDNLLEQGVEFDAIGQSYYPFWHGMPEDLEMTLDFLSKRYGKDLYLAEVAYPHRHHPLYDNPLNEEPEQWRRYMEKYPLTPVGQAEFLDDVIEVVKGVAAGRGIFYWAPEWTPVKGMMDEADAPACWARALFDADGNALPAFDVLRKHAVPLLAAT